MARTSSNTGWPSGEDGDGSDLLEDAPRTGTHPALIATFIVLALIGLLIGWLAITDGEQVAAPSVTLRIDAGQDGQVEKLAPSEADQLAEADTPVALGRELMRPEANVAKRILPTSQGIGGRIRLGPAPDHKLVEQSPSGPLPRIGDDGAQAWHVYSRPFPVSDTRPKIAIVIGGMGLSRTTTDFALKRLPGPVSVSFTPYAQGLQEWVDETRKAGHELLLELPMEPYDFPENDPGPQALLTDLSAIENTNRLEWLMSRFTGYIGVINFLGAKFTTAEAALGPIMAELKGRGLMIIDDNSTRRSLIGELAGRVDMPVLLSNRQIDSTPAADHIDAKLAELEKRALTEGKALGVGFSYPVTIDRVAVWAAQLDGKGIALAPASALLRDGGS